MEELDHRVTLEILVHLVLNKFRMVSEVKKVTEDILGQQDHQVTLGSGAGMDLLADQVYQYMRHRVGLVQRGHVVQRATKESQQEIMT